MGSNIIGVKEAIVEEKDKIEGTYKLKLVDGKIREYPLACVY